MSNYDDTRRHPELLAEMEAVRQLSDDALRAAVVESYGGQEVPDVLINRSSDTVLNVALFRLMKRGGPSKPHDFDKANRPKALEAWWARLTEEQRAEAVGLRSGQPLTSRQLLLLAESQFPISYWTRGVEPREFVVPDDVAEFIAARTD